jgi:hypothetical protein
MPEWQIREIEPLIKSLASDDAFARLEAIEKLEDLTRRTFGFRFNDPLDARTRAIQRWKDWIQEQQQDQEREEKLKTAVELSGGAIDLGALKKAIHEIPAEKIQGYLNALIMKMKTQQARCEACHVRPASVRVTELEGGKPKTVHLCESCARERGDALL